jgi:hypothetical protein
MTDLGAPENRLALVLEELARFDAAALCTVRNGDQQKLCEISERLLGLHARFAAAYRAMLVSGRGTLVVQDSQPSSRKDRRVRCQARNPREGPSR